MSLKAFHIVFICASVLLSLSLGGFALTNFLSASGTRMDLVWASLAFVSGAGLLVYGKFFLRKLKNISYL